MAKMTIVYKTPEDKEAFDKHYFNIHLPLAKKLPGLRKYEISEGAVFSPTGHSDIYLIAHLILIPWMRLKRLLLQRLGSFARQTGELTHLMIPAWQCICMIQKKYNHANRLSFNSN